jgi:general secretion pathway protein D
MVRFLWTLVVCAAVCAASDTAADGLFKAAQRAEKAGDILHAYLLYARAASLDPKNVQYATRKAALRSMAALSAREELGPDPAEQRAIPIPGMTPEEMRETNPPARLAISKEKKTFDLRGDARDIFEKVAAAYGIQVVFESDYQAPPAFRFQLTDAGMEDAFRTLETVGNSFFVPVNERMALVVRDTPAKRTERAPWMTVSIPIPERMTVQDAQELLTAVQQSMDIRRATVDPGRRMVFLRDQASKVTAARQMFFNVSKIRPQVEVELEFLSVERNSSLNYGMKLPTQFSIVDFKGMVSLPTALTTLERLTAAGSPFAMGITNASVFATLAKSRSENLLNAQIVSLDGQAATLHVGQRYPIVTNQYVGNTTGQAGTVYTPPPTVNYEDLGLVLKVTPWIHEGDEVTLEVEAEFKTLAAQSGVSGIPVVANRKYTGKIRMREGEWGVIAGLVQMNESENRTGWPWLSQIPWIGHFFTQNDIEKNSSQVLLVLKPHLTTMPPWEMTQQPIWVGTETRPISVY